jgi:hypothetical protein
MFDKKKTKDKFSLNKMFFISLENFLNIDIYGLVLLI